MKRNILKTVLMAVSLLAAFSCEEEVLPPLEGTGVTEASWNGDIRADEEGSMLSLTFTAADAWTAESSDPSWCEIITPEGVKGSAALRIDLKKNINIEPRSVKIAIKVKGYPLPEEIAIVQAEGVTEQGDGRYREINEWTYEKMSQVYLWNEPIPSLALDYSIGYQPFLKSILDGVAKFDDINHDDGAYKEEFRTEYYTQIVSSAPDTKTVGQEATGNGFYRLRPVDLGVAIGVVVDTVIPDGPADKQGIKRGHFITAVNGVEITRDNYKSVTNKIYTDAVSVQINTVTWEGEKRDQAVVTPAGTVDLEPERYLDPAIYKAETVELNNGKKVGYLLYMGFHTDFDEDLMAVFDKFKADGIEDLVLDLRYNNGGEILSSTVMATMIAGEQYKGQTLAKLTFNKVRTEAGESAVYKIGVPETIEYPDGYLAIEEALQHAIGLDRVFIIASNYTASASEIIINGLRGLDIEVNLIGTKTSGKNVGMEGFSKRFRNYDFLLYPVSFYIENAKGFRDYPDGFEPDVYLNDTSIYPGGDFGSPSDFLCNVAYGWIASGQKPSLKSTKAHTADQLAPAVPYSQRPGGSLVIYRDQK